MTYPPTRLPQPISIGMFDPRPVLVEGVAINCLERVLNPVRASATMFIEVDGWVLPPARWGRIEIPLAPGRYRFTIFTQKPGGPRKWVADLVDSVEPGELRELDYRQRRYGFGWELQRSLTPRQRVYLLVFVAIAIPTVWAILMFLSGAW